MPHASRRPRTPRRSHVADDARGRNSRRACIMTAHATRSLPVIDSAPIDHADAAATFLENEARVDWHDGAIWFAREKRDRAVSEVPEWEALRALASEIKEHTLSHLDEYLIAFE